MSGSNGITRPEPSHHLLLDEFGDDCDVSLSGLCLGSVAASVDHSHLPLINQVFGSLGDIVKVEDEFNMGLVAASSVANQSHAPHQVSVGHDGHLNASVSGTINLNMPSPSITNTSSSGSTNQCTTTPAKVGKSHSKERVTSATLANSPVVQMPIGQPSTHHAAHQHRHQIHHHHHQPQQQQHHSHHLNTIAASTSPVGSSSSILVHHLDLAPVVSSAHHHHHHTFDPQEVFYADSNPDDSCQSSSYSNEAASLRTKPAVLQTVLESLIHDDKPSSKRICFKGLVDRKDEETLSNEQHQQQQQQLNQELHVQQQDHADLVAIAGPLFNMEQKISPEALNESIYSSLNVANCYSYEWRRWSKTDAPSVKNRAGTVQVPHTMVKLDEDNRKFQYILGAPTSAGTRVGFMTMTYLNQGQSYEIRLKKFKKIQNEPNLRSCVRIGFVEKRLQFRENEELAGWNRVHANDRMIDIDFSMSYGVFDVNLQSTYNNSMTFVWNPGREASIFIKINSISTEFTSKRHGGERGTPFRLVVDTFSLDTTKIDSACCLIKVFKSKGAERKHKTDRDRVAKHRDAENFYQPSYDCTLLVTYKEDEEDDEEGQSPVQSPDSDRHSLHGSNKTYLPCTDTGDSSSLRDNGLTNISPLSPSGSRRGGNISSESLSSISSPISTTDTLLSSSTMIPTPSTPSSCSQLPQSTSHTEDSSYYIKSPTQSSSNLSFNAGAIETYEWLKRNRFFRLAEQLCDYTADDLRRLSKDDLIQLCDLKDGIRLYNLIHTPETVTTKLTIFITVDGNEHYALYFKNLSVDEFRDKLVESFNDTALMRIRHIHLIGPNGIKVKLTNNVIQNMKDESIYNCVLNKVDEEYDIVLRLANTGANNC